MIDSIIESSTLVSMQAFTQGHLLKTTRPRSIRVGLDTKVETRKHVSSLP